MTRFVCLLASSTVGLVACTGEAPIVDDSPTSLLRDGEGFLQGDLHRVRGFDDALSRLWVDAYPGGAHVELHVEGEYGWAMVAVDLWGATLGEGPLAPGRTVSVQSDGAGGAGVVSGISIGCSGPDYGEFEFDEEADVIQLGVGEDAETGEIVVVVDAGFGAAGHVTGVAPARSVR
jgi:hypothetical protein